MKLSYKRMLLFQFFIFLFILFNSFIFNVLGKYGIVIFLVILLLIFKSFFGLEKDRQRYTKDILIEILIIMIVFIILFISIGLFVGFSKVDNYYTLYGIVMFVFPIIITTVLKEYLRYNMLKKSEGFSFLILILCLNFTFFDITNLMFGERFNSAYNIFIFLALIFLPALCNNIAATYISIKAGYKPNIVWLLIVRLYYYLFPIVPALNDYVYSLIFIFLPLILVYRIYCLIKKTENNDKKRKINKSDYIVSGVILSLLVMVIYFTCGYFKYFVLSIGSGSMSPKINVGDIVVAEKIKDKKNLEVDDIIVFKYHNVTIVHRIAKVVENDNDNEIYYYTKGDNNEKVDNYIVYEDMIIAKVSFKIPYVGLPSVWLNNL